MKKSIFKSALVILDSFNFRGEFSEKFLMVLSGWKSFDSTAILWMDINLIFDILSFALKIVQHKFLEG